MRIPRRWLSSFLLLLALVAPLRAQTVFVVRHAERTGEPDPPLNAEGRRRADALARLLSEANLTGFYCSEAVRSIQTAEPSAKRAGKQIRILKDKDIQGIIELVRTNTKPGESALMVGHRSTVPLIVKALGGGEIAPIGPAEHDRLFVLGLVPGGPARLVVLRYGDPPAASQVNGR